MNAEELLKLLKEQGLEDEAIKKLLSDAIASLQGSAEQPSEEDEEKAEAGKLLGVTL